jgi:hypothetical protein
MVQQQICANRIDQLETSAVQMNAVLSSASEASAGDAMLDSFISEVAKSGLDRMYITANGSESSCRARVAQAGESIGGVTLTSCQVVCPSIGISGCFGK